MLIVTDASCTFLFNVIRLHTGCVTIKILSRREQWGQWGNDEVVSEL